MDTNSTGAFAEGLPIRGGWGGGTNLCGVGGAGGGVGGAGAMGVGKSILFRPASAIPKAENNTTAVTAISFFILNLLSF